MYTRKRQFYCIQIKEYILKATEYQQFHVVQPNRCYAMVEADGCAGAQAAEIDKGVRDGLEKIKMFSTDDKEEGKQGSCLGTGMA